MDSRIAFFTGVTALTQPRGATNTAALLDYQNEALQDEHYTGETAGLETKREISVNTTERSLV